MGSVEVESVNNKKLGGEKKEKMKTKNKVLAIVQIAVVLCSLFLVALPAIAAQEQNQEMQKASTSITTAASEDDYVLGIYGNANEDDTIDMGDVVYTKLAIFGKKPKTELCDAKYDGRINVLDVIQTKLIILGKEKELTVVDSADRIVTVKKPIKRAIALSYHSPEAIRTFGVVDKIVGVSSYFKEMEFYYPELSKLPGVGIGSNLDYEAMLSLNPDFVLTSGSRRVSTEEIAEKLPGITVIGLHFGDSKAVIEDVWKFGYIFGKKDVAEYYFDDFHDKYIDYIKAQTEKLPEEKRPKVYFEGWQRLSTGGLSYGAESPAQQVTDICGGRNIFADVPGVMLKLDPEAVIERNPDIIVKYVNENYPQWAGIEKVGYGVDDSSDMKALRESIMNRPELANVAAVKTGRVYVVVYSTTYGLAYPIGTAYFAKWFHPDIFEDLDPQTIHQEWLDRFMRMDFNVYEHGVFVYPEEPVS